MMNDHKKALAVVAGPYRFYQVLWLYTQYFEYEWSILLLPYGKGNEHVDKLYNICAKLGIFHHIYRAKMTGKNSSLQEQMHLFMQMAVFALAGRAKKLMKKILLEQTEGNDFDAAFVGCEYSVIEGSIIGLADEKEVYIFEEGLGDYWPRKRHPTFKINEIISFLVSQMGYFNPFGYFRLKNTSFCVKYSSLPHLLKYRNYKEIRILFEGNEETKQRFMELIRQAYLSREVSLDQYDVILLTTPMSYYVENKSDYYIDRLHEFLLKNYAGKNILIKKHPRDIDVYEWKDLQCDFINAEIPLEVFGEFIGNQEIIMMSASTALLTFLQKDNGVSFVYFDDIHGNYEKDFLYLFELFEIRENNIIRL